MAYAQPARFPIAAQNAARVFRWLHERDPAEAVRWAHDALRAYFLRGVDLVDSPGPALQRFVAASGIEAQAAEAAWSDPHWKARLKAEGEAASARGVFGAPFLFVDDEPFWGNDRRDQIERWIARAF